MEIFSLNNLVLYLLSSVVGFLFGYFFIEPLINEIFRK